MPKYFDGVKKVTSRKTKHSVAHKTEEEGRDNYEADLMPHFFTNAKKSVRELWQERVSAKAENFHKKEVKHKDLMSDSIVSSPTSNIDQAHNVEAIWHLAIEDKTTEKDKIKQKLKKQKAKEKLRASIMALKMQKKHKHKTLYKKAIDNIDLAYKVNNKDIIHRLWDYCKIFTSRFMHVGKKITRFLLLPLIAIIIVFVGMSIAVYKLPSDNDIRQLIIYHVPVPAMFINYYPVSYKSYMDEDRLFGYYYLIQLGMTDAEKRNAATILSLKNKEVFNHIVEKNILNHLRNKYNVTISLDEKQKFFEQMAQDNGGVEEFTESIYNDYGLTKDIFIENIVYYNILKIKLSNVFSEDSSIHRKARMRIDSIVKLYNKNNDFENLAEKYSEDDHALKGGDIGYVNVEDMSSEMKAAVDQLGVGMISKVLQDNDRYYIVKLYDRKKIDGGEEVLLKQISIFTNYSFEDYLHDLMNNAKIWNFVK